MSEEILKALMQLFAIIAKQDVGLSVNEREFVQVFLKQQLNESSVKEYLTLFDNHIGINKDAENAQDTKAKPKLTSVKDSVKTLGIAKKINKTLTQKQKVVVLVRLFELVNSDKKFTPQRMAIIDTAAEVFNISREEYQAIESFVLHEPDGDFTHQDMLVIGNMSNDKDNYANFIDSPQLEGKIIILRVPSVELYFLRYTGSSELLLNGLPIVNSRIYLFANGSVIKQPKGKPIFYTDIASTFLSDSSAINVVLKANNVSLKFPNGYLGLRNIHLQEQSGKMIAIMGSSGAGKTTLLNVLSGINKPTSGDVFINGKKIHDDIDSIKGIIGYIPQDDLLIEELTVYQNLYFSTKLVYRDLTENEIHDKVIKVLTSLGLFHIKDLKVGNPLNKKISGGQRKRLNIGLELIREPAVLFVDEPTSGLSSRDSENVMELLRELAVRGKLIFVVIHQPSSEIYKMFDNVIILDEGGYQIYYGNPVEAVIYFKTLDNQINSDIGECPTCGNVNPETVFSIIESRIVDEYGRPTANRKVMPHEWNEHFRQNTKRDKASSSFDPLPESFKKPNWLNQFKIFFKRDMFSKLSNTQYLVLNLLEAPILGFLLAFIIKYIDDPTSNIYIFRENENIMPYIFMCTIVALFLGLIVSAEEIYKDRKILKRETFLNLSRSSYLFSKIGILFIISAIQAFLFVLVGNYILGVQGMYFEYWLMFFTLAAFANVLGLNISSAFNSAVTIYILIPFLIIPQMVLTGAMFNFDKINRVIGGGQDKVPIIAEAMPSRWAFEGLITYQYTNNKYAENFYELNKLESIFNYKNVFYLPELKRYVENYKFRKIADQEPYITEDNLELLRNELNKENNSPFFEAHNLKFNYEDQLYKDKINIAVADSLVLHITKLQEFYRDNFNHINDKIDNIILQMTNTPEKRETYQQLKDDYYNDYLADFVKNRFAPLPVVRLGNRLVQKIDPIYLDPQDPNKFSVRTHFLAPRKNFFGIFVKTFYFNVGVIWILTLLLYMLLYYEGLKGVLNLFGNFGPTMNIKLLQLKSRISRFFIKLTGI
ncbi:MAG: ATP-binding cassette domain-containing protein [Bacteroidales bacterium]